MAIFSQFVLLTLLVVQEGNAESLANKFRACYASEPAFSSILCVRHAYTQPNEYKREIVSIKFDSTSFILVQSDEDTKSRDLVLLTQDANYYASAVKGSKIFELNMKDAKGTGDFRIESVFDYPNSNAVIRAAVPIHDLLVPLRMRNEYLVAIEKGKVTIGSQLETVFLGETMREGKKVLAFRSIFPSVDGDGADIFLHCDDVGRVVEIEGYRDTLPDMQFRKQLFYDGTSIWPSKIEDRKFQSLEPYGRVDYLDIQMGIDVSAADFDIATYVPGFGESSIPPIIMIAGVILVAGICVSLLRWKKSRVQ